MTAPPTLKLADVLLQAAQNEASTMLADVFVTGRADREGAEGAISRMAANSANMMHVWRTLASRKTGTGDFMHGKAASDRERAKQAAHLFRLAATAFIMKLATETESEIQTEEGRRMEAALAVREFAPDLSKQLVERAELMRKSGDYRLRVERKRTDARLRGFVVTVAGACEYLFSSKLPAVTARFAQAAFDASAPSANQVREMLRDLPPGLRPPEKHP